MLNADQKTCSRKNFRRFDLIQKGKLHICDEPRPTASFSCECVSSQVQPHVTRDITASMLVSKTGILMFACVMRDMC